MRLYLVVNRYSIAIQAGIQALHVIPEMYEKYKSKKWDPEYSKNLTNWATKHKTVMVMRHFGGHEETEELYAKIAKPARALHLPFALFREGALKDCATAFGVVVPTEYYSHPIEELGSDLAELKTILSPFPFAT